MRKGIDHMNPLTNIDEQERLRKRYLRKKDPAAAALGDTPQQRATSYLNAVEAEQDRRRMAEAMGAQTMPAAEPLHSAEYQPQPIVQMVPNPTTGRLQMPHPASPSDRANFNYTDLPPNYNN